MDSLTVQALMKLHEVRGVDIAKALDVSPSAVSQVIHGVRRSQRIELEIARRCGVTRDKLFGPTKRQPNPLPGGSLHNPSSPEDPWGGK